AAAHGCHQRDTTILEANRAMMNGGVSFSDHDDGPARGNEGDPVEGEAASPCRNSGGSAQPNDRDSIDTRDLTARVRGHARELGFDAVGIARADVSLDRDIERYNAFVDAGM